MKPHYTTFLYLLAAAVVFGVGLAITERIMKMPPPLPTPSAQPPANSFKASDDWVRWYFEWKRRDTALRQPSDKERDERRYLDGLASELNRQMREACVAARGNDPMCAQVYFDEKALVYVTPVPPPQPAAQQPASR